MARSSFRRGEGSRSSIRPQPQFDESSKSSIRPQPLHELGEDEARRLVAAEVARQVAQARAEIEARYGKVLGPVAARNASPFQRAKSWETFGALNPRFATGPGCVVERIEAAEELVAYLEDYRAAWRRYRAGESDVVFPYGCYLMRVRHGVRVAPAPS